MKTFLDTNVRKTKSFILYGNLKDKIWCPDLMPRDLEHYLVKVLKSRGYEHVVFFGGAGTKGAYCLDEKSARFFFPLNKGIPLPKVLNENFDDPSKADQNDENQVDNNQSCDKSVSKGKKRGKRVADAMSKHTQNEKYIPGAPPENVSDENEKHAEVISGEETEKNALETEKEIEQKNVFIQYASRGMTLNEFMKIIHPLMLERDSHMAVVFYNILTTSMVDSYLRDDILDIWEKNSKGNICLMLLPESQDNPSTLQARVCQYGLESKFLKQISGSTDVIPNPLNCICIGQPNIDEIKHMLRYLSLIGTKKRNRIHFEYSALDKIAERIQYASGEKAIEASEGVELAKESMEEIFLRIADYIDSKGKIGKTVDIEISDIDRIWDIDSDAGKTLQKLNKPGWEPAYNKVIEALEIAEKTRRRIDEQSDKEDEKKQETADWGVKRIERLQGVKEKRSTIPNFVLLGNPGTGKTTIARMIGKILHEAGILKIGHHVPTTKKDLTNSYVAGVPQATMSKVNEAEEGVLFIDEAHLLGKKDGGANHGGTGVEVVSTLNAAMTDPNHHFSVIIAGYEDEMEAVFKLDPGFKSRFGNNFIYLEDYSPELLSSILLRELRERGYTIDEKMTSESQVADTTYVPIECMVQRIYDERDRKRFGNARVMINLAEHAEGKSKHGVITQECFYGGVDGKIDNEWFKPKNVGASIEYVLEEMNRKFVGMEKAKDAVKKIGLKLEECKARGKSLDEIELRPIVLVGNPGVGKSSLAEMLPKLYFHYGILGTSKPIMITASDLACSLAGGTQEKILEYIHDAQDVKGFLFVDEAHNLADQHFDGKGALKAFLAPLTDKKHPFMACFGVYANHLNEFLKLDPGAKSRFRIIHLEDYSPEELFEIMKKMVAERGYTTTEETDNLLMQVFERVYATKMEDTGNARMVERIIEQMDELRVERCVSKEIPFDSPESFVYVPEDIPEELRKNLTLRNDNSKIERLRQVQASVQTERVGAEELKNELLKKIQSLLYKEKYPKGRKVKVIEPGHYFFTGNPGTGKTTGVEFFAKYMHELGLITDPKPIRISASKLVGQYLGETGVKTREQLEDSVGHVLMVDEAYALGDPNDRANSYKRDAINEIINFLDDETYRKCTCVVFAGYEKDMKNLYEMNDGFKSRVKEINFSDFTLEQCIEILKSMLASEGIGISGEVEQICTIQIQKMQNFQAFSNGRTIRRYSKLLMQMLEQRCIDNMEIYAENDPRAYEIQQEDVPEMEIVLKELNIN